MFIEINLLDHNHKARPCSWDNHTSIEPIAWRISSWYSQVPHSLFSTHPELSTRSRSLQKWCHTSPSPQDVKQSSEHQRPAVVMECEKKNPPKSANARAKKKKKKKQKITITIIIMAKIGKPLQYLQHYLMASSPNIFSASNYNVTTHCFLVGDTIIYHQEKVLPVGICTAAFKALISLHNTQTRSIRNMHT